MPTSTLSKGVPTDAANDSSELPEQFRPKVRVVNNTSRDAEISKPTPMPAPFKVALALFDGFMEPDKFVQLVVLGLSSHLIYLKYGSEQSSIEQGPMMLSVVAAYFVNVFLTASSSGIGEDALPPFNTIYLFYLQAALSILFAPEYILLNTVLAFSISDLTLVLKIPLQMVFLLLTNNESSFVEISAKALVLNYFFIYGLYRASELKSLDKMECHMFAILCTNIVLLFKSDSIHFQVMRVCFTSFVIIVVITTALRLVLKNLSLHQSARTIILLPIIIIGFPYFIQKNLVIDGIAPFTWLLDYIGSSETRISIMKTWLGSALLLFPSVFTLKSNWSLNTSRKVWHFAVLPLLIPAIALDTNFVKIALAGTVNLFLIVEYIRFLHIFPIGDYLDKHLRSFADFRDEKGPIIISYLYFIIGISLPFLLNGSVIGIVSLGVGDSLASIVGKKFGKRYWPNMSKTLEGTTAFILSTVATTLSLKMYLNFFPDISSPNLVIVCFLAGILEGNSTLNDNLLVPTFMLIALEALK